MDLLYQCDFIALSFHLNYAMVIKEQGWLDIIYLVVEKLLNLLKYGVFRGFADPSTGQETLRQAQRTLD